MQNLSQYWKFAECTISKTGSHRAQNVKDCKAGFPLWSGYLRTNGAEDIDSVSQDCDSNYETIGSAPTNAARQNN